MYERHFGLREPPFRLTPDTGSIFAARQHHRAFNTLAVAIAQREGFVKITGEVGTGKTLLCRRLLRAARNDLATAYIPYPAIEPRALLLAIASELAIPVPDDADGHRLHKALALGLLRLARAGRNVILCIDEAQAMPIDTLETLRLLTNLETEKRRLMQVILFGQPELDRKLADPRIRQLHQRISFEYRLGDLSRDELPEYLTHRLRRAGHPDGELFAPRAARLVYRYSGGRPRLANILAHKALMLAFGEGRAEVLPRHVRAAAADTSAARADWRRYLWGGLGLASLAAAGLARAALR